MTYARVTSAAVTGMALPISATTGRAAADEDIPAMPAGLHGSIGMGVAVIPEYEGSKDHKVRARPNINLLRFKTEQGIAITAGPLLAMRRGRDEDSNEVLSGLGDIDTALDAGGFFISASKAGRLPSMSGRMSRIATKAQW